MIEIEKIPDYARHALQKPDYFSYWGSDDMFVTWGFTGIDRYGNSSLVDLSNFEVISKDLMDRFPDDFRIECYRHWAVGHVNRLVCHILHSERNGFVNENITEAFKAVIDWHNNLLMYPIADESHYYDIEFEAIQESFNQLPAYLLEMIDTSDPEWVFKVYSELVNYMNVEIVPDADLWPKDGEILEAVYHANLFNEEKTEEWDKWCNDRNWATIKFKKINNNLNQLKLFEESNDN